MPGRPGQADVKSWRCPCGEVPLQDAVHNGREQMKNLFARFIREDEGQDLIEYAFLAVFIALAVTVGLGLVATGINTQMSNIGANISST